MGLSRTGVGLIQVADFNDGTIPAWLTKVEDTAGRVTVASGLCTIYTSATAQYAYLVATNALTKTNLWVTRMKLRTSVSSQSPYQSGLLDLASRPTGAVTLAQNVFRALYYNASSGTTQCATAEAYGAGLWSAGTFAVADYYIYEYQHGATASVLQYRKLSDLSVYKTGGYNWAFTNNPFWYVGDCMSAYHYGTFIVDYMQQFTSLNLTVSGLGAGNAVRVYDGSNNVKASAVASGGVATLDLQLLEFPFTGYVKVFTDNTYVTELARWPDAGNQTDIYGGDALTYVNIVNQTITPTATTAASSPQVPVLSAGSLLGPASAALSALANTPGLSAGSLLVSPLVTADTLANVPAVSLSYIITPTVATGQTTVLVPTLEWDANLLATLAVADSEAKIPSLLWSACIMALPAVETEVACEAPTVTATSNILAAVAESNLLAFNPEWCASYIIEAAEATATGEAKDPRLSLGATISAVVATEAGLAQIPSISADALLQAISASSTGTVYIPVAHADAAVLAVEATGASLAIAPNVIVPLFTGTLYYNIAGYWQRGHIKAFVGGEWTTPALWYYTDGVWKLIDNT